MPVPADDIWRVLADVTRVGEWSHECRTARWLHGASAPAVGVRFRGGNRSGAIRWTRTNEIVGVEPGRAITWRTLPSVLYPDSTEWRIEAHDVGQQTRIAQSYRILRLSGLLERLYATVIPAHRDRAEALRQDLLRLADAGTARSINRTDEAVVPGNG